MLIAIDALPINNLSVRHVLSGHQAEAMWWRQPRSTDRRQAAEHRTGQSAQFSPAAGEVT